MENRDYRMSMEDSRFRGSTEGDSGGGTNRQYKDRLFKAIFGAEERKHLTLELYNAMNGSSYTNPDQLELKTIDNVVFMGMRNDVSFLLDQVMNLWEQQSTSNPNMPLRFLMYYAHMMERHVKMMTAEEGDIYSGSLIRIPTPRMVLFYNGPGRVPDYLFLSDAYVDATDPDVQVRVRVININSGQDRLLEQCAPLQDYTTFVETFCRYREQEGISDREAAGRAIRELRPGEVREYLEAHEAEVVDMLLTEYDEEKTLKAEYYYGKREGLKEGLQRGLQQGMQHGRATEQENSLRMLFDMITEDGLPVEAAVRRAARLGITNEADFRRRAAELGIQLPD